MSKTDLSLTLIENDKRYPKFYLSKRDQDNCVAGVGKKEGFHTLPKERCFGIFPFSHKSGHPWDGVPIQSIIEPELWLEGKSDLAIGSDHIPELVQVEDVPEKERWTKHCQAMVGVLGPEKKVVFSRMRRYFFDRPPCPYALLRRIGRRCKNCYHGLYMPQPGVAFLSWSPERLFRRKERSIQVEALAGTRRPDLPALSLLQSEKDRREHAFVSKAMEEVLAPLCHDIQVTDPTVKAFTHWQHLSSCLQGRLHDGVSDQYLIHQLHPSAALCGSPREFALQVIETEEAWSRGCFAGVMGVFSEQASECMVTIRSCLIRGRSLYAFAGVGLVEGSEAEQEWDESECKLGLFEEVFRGSCRRVG